MPWKTSTIMNEKFRFVSEASEPEANMSELCRTYSISRETGYTWVKRFRELGIVGLQEQSRRPHSITNETSAEMVCEIVKQRALHLLWGGKKIRYHLLKKFRHAPVARTIDRVLERCGLVVKRRRKRRKILKSSEVIQAKYSNHIWTLDIKGWWRTQDGEKVYPVTVRDEFRKYILDIAMLPSTDTTAIKARFHALFERYGLPEIIRTDNGPPFAMLRALCGLTKLSVWFLKLGIIVNRIPPASPQYNGAHERMHLDMARELQTSPAKNIREEQARADRWRNDYNFERPHEALHGKTPGELYKRSRKRFNQQELEYHYPANFHLRKVNCIGKINWKNSLYYLSKALAGQTIAIEIINAKRINIYFCEFLLASTNIDFSAGLTEYSLTFIQNLSTKEIA